MNEYLSLPLVAEAIVLDVLCNFDCISFQKMSSKFPLDELSEILTTVTNFADAFSEMFGEIFDSFCLKYLSEEEFIDFIIPRCLILSKEKTYFNLMLACSFVSEIVFYFISDLNCFHFAKLAYKCLSLIMKLKFEDLFKMENGWRDLFSFCEKINQLVTVYSIEKTLWENSIVNINKSDSLSDDPLIKQFNSFNIADLKTNVIEDNKLQAKLDGSLSDAGNLVGVENGKPNTVENGEFVDRYQKQSSIETEFIDNTQCDKPNKIEFLYELLTESNDHLNEVLDLIDACGEEIDSCKYSQADCGDLCGDMQKISAMVERSSQDDTSICECIDSEAIHCNEMKMVRGVEHSTSPSTNTSDEESSELPPKSSDGRHSGCLPLNASDTGNFNSCPSTASEDNDSTGPSLKLSENDFNLCICCELCRGKKHQYMMSWENDFLSRYLEPKSDKKILSSFSRKMNF